MDPDSPPSSKNEDRATRRILVTVAYDGTDFSGWQIQPGQRTVQGKLSEALAEMEKEAVKIRGAGRTDAGVHAKDQKASFETRSNIPCVGYVRGLNAILPNDVAVRSARVVPRDFDPRFWTCVKVYRYAVHNNETRDPILGRYALHVQSPLDADAMHRAGQQLAGTHDFNAFRAADCERRDPVRTIKRVSVSREGPNVIVEVEGFAFLKYMVRIIAGTLIEVGRGKLSTERVAAILESKDRTQAGPTAPPFGLTLAQVTYPDLAEAHQDGP